MKVLSALNIGRLGNVIFRYLAMVTFAVVYDAEIVENDTVQATITEELFIAWMTADLRGIPLCINTNLTYGFVGYFQHDTIYLKYRQQIINYIRNHPNDTLTTDGKTPVQPEFTYEIEHYKAIHLLEHPTGLKQIYDIVVHLRLEDFIKNGFVIHPESVKKLLESVGAPSYCIVVNNLTSELELMYIEYLRKYFTITIESNDIITDYHIMKNAKTLICSFSTASWAAAFFSDTIQTLYMPNYPMVGRNETFRKPIKNTVFYEYRQCNEEELSLFLKIAV